MNKVGFKESRISDKHYFEWRKNRSKKSVEKVDKLIALENKIVLDVGCGYGALSSTLLDKGSIVYGTETTKYKLDIANKLIKNKNFSTKLVKSEDLPFTDKFFDVIFLFDVIEHVADPLKILKECERVLKPNGILYVEFTPYYSITGHHLYDYAKWPIHILPKEKIKKIIYSKNVKSYFTPQYYWELFLSLNKLRISNFQNMVNNKFRKLDERFIIKYPEVFELNLAFVDKLGKFKDYFTMSYEGVFRKNNS
jgi:ubiquinone/menaquinone biosynthesis C-methylase UbiE